ncbi:type IV pilus modification PilV family protein [Microbacterium invictum]|uniref:Prepilin-type N-terminal cleavage/methylation domain-containing protein n=1 Tax=Microbacterium invictum TaxID=515415 RepID=A0AA40VM86_9MICO|nr:type II secretion system protein [Microbacterium invictum]MBB4139429.1 prepilin-type N-terminal cleavage/methylation domain-containing protein [Microbacterium invictum]
MTKTEDDGFSLVEVIIALFLFAVISLAVLPLLISGVSLSVVNRDVVAATALANDRLAQLRDEFPTAKGTVRTCNALLTAVAAIDPDEPSNRDLTVTAVASPDKAGDPVCPTGAAAYPRSILVTFTVTDSEGRLVSVPTRISVGAAS